MICGCRRTADRTELIRAEESIRVLFKDWSGDGPVRVGNAFDCGPSLTEQREPNFAVNPRDTASALMAVTGTLGHARRCTSGKHAVLDAPEGVHHGFGADVGIQKAQRRCPAGRRIGRIASMDVSAP